jgi:hypothetical protein
MRPYRSDKADAELDNVEEAMEEDLGDAAKKPAAGEETERETQQQEVEGQGGAVPRDGDGEGGREAEGEEDRFGDDRRHDDVAEHGNGNGDGNGSGNPSGRGGNRGGARKHVAFPTKTNDEKWESSLDYKLRPVLFPGEVDVAEYGGRDIDE